MNQKLAYFLVSLAYHLLGQKLACPSCQGRKSTAIDRKMLVTELRRCAACGLLFRAPTTSAERSSKFYQMTYRQGFTTDLPDDAKLAWYLKNRFIGTEKDYTPYLNVLSALGYNPGSRLFDFGCSWGYGTWQLRSKGYAVEAFEISSRRASYARERLQLSVSSELPRPAPEFHVFFSCHVLEHVPCVRDTILSGMNMLSPEGLFLAFTPNGSLDFRKKDPEAWHQLWGLVHPNMLDVQFYARQFAHCSFLIASTPYDMKAIEQWAAADSPGQQILDTSGGELVIAVRAPASPRSRQNR